MLQINGIDFGETVDPELEGRATETPIFALNQCISANNETYAGCTMFQTAKESIRRGSGTLPIMRQPPEISITVNVGMRDAQVRLRRFIPNNRDNEQKSEILSRSRKFNVKINIGLQDQH